MKKVLIAVFLLAAFSTVSFSRDFVASGKTHTSLGDYKIEISEDPVVFNNEALKTYVITYENSPLTVKVAIKPEKKCKDYLVISETLSVKYVCNKNYFGVEKIDQMGLKTSDETLNRSEYFHQKVLTPGQGDETENTRLIAAYFPMLIKDDKASI
jgi:hypothetical protein